MEGPCLKTEAQADAVPECDPSSGTGVKPRMESTVVGGRTTTSVAVRIQHHPSRVELAERLTEQVAAFDDVEVIEDPEPTAHRNAWRSHRACLEAVPASATHLLVLQDDAVPTEGFYEALSRAITERPESVLLPFIPGFAYLRKQMRETRATSESFMRFNPRSFVPVVAIVYPAPVAQDLLAWAEQRGHRRGADDGIVAFYCKARRIFPAAMVPCICDHDETAQTIGAANRRGAHRRAALL